MFYNKENLLRVSILIMCFLSFNIAVRADSNHTCLGDEFPGRLFPGVQGITLKGVSMYHDPASIDPAFAELAPGTRFMVLPWADEPQCYDEQLWIYVEIDDGTTGWIPEVIREEYLLEPLQSDCPTIPATDYIDEEKHDSWTGDSFDITGESATVTIDPGTNLDFGASDFSASVWINLSGRDQDGVIFDKRYEFETVQGMVLTASYQRLIFQLADGLSEQKPYATVWTNYIAATPISIEKWHLINVVVDRDNIDGGRFIWMVSSS